MMATSGLSDCEIPTATPPASLGARCFAWAASLLKNKRLLGILQVLVSLALLAWLARRVGVASVAETLAGIAWSWYVPAFALFMANVVLRACRWRVLLGELRGQVTLGQLVYLYLVGFFFNNFIPSGFGGDVVKVISLRGEHGHGAQALGSVIMDRATGLVGSALIALVALAWNGAQGSLGHEAADLSLPPALLLSIAAVSLGVPAGFALLRWVDPLGLLARRSVLARRLAASARLKRFTDALRSYPPSTLVKALLVSLPFTLGLIATQYSIARALAVDVPFRVFPLFVPIIGIVNLLPISFNGLGVRENVYGFLFSRAGVSGADAVGMSLAFYFLRVSAGLIGGLLHAVRGTRVLTRPAQSTNEG